VLQTPVIPGVHAYVHYFTLYDIHARGFVRPMCLAFVSRDRSKLEKEFLNLRENFLKVKFSLVE
jgi:guanine nucleotide exchange protein SMCR8